MIRARTADLVPYSCVFRRESCLEGGFAVLPPKVLGLISKHFGRLQRCAIRVLADTFVPLVIAHCSTLRILDLRNADLSTFSCGVIGPALAEAPQSLCVVDISRGPHDPFSSADDNWRGVIPAAFAEACLRRFPFVVFGSPDIMRSAVLSLSRDRNPDPACTLSLCGHAFHRPHLMALYALQAPTEAMQLCADRGWAVSSCAPWCCQVMNLPTACLRIL